MKMQPDFESENFTELTKEEIVNFLVMQIAYKVGNNKRILFIQLSIYYGERYTGEDNSLIVGSFAVSEKITNFEMKLSKEQLKHIINLFHVQNTYCYFFDGMNQGTEELVHYTTLT